MKNIFTLFLFFVIKTEAQNSDKGFVYDAATNSVRFADNSRSASTSVSSLSAVLGHSILETLNPDSKESYIALTDVRSSTNSFITNNYSSSLNSLSNSISNLDLDYGLIKDSSRLIFSSFTNIDEAIYKSKNEIGSFVFKQNVLISDEGVLLPIRATYFSNSIISSLSSGPDNGGITIEQGIFQTDWKGFDTASYATLTASHNGQPVSFILNPSANLSNDNQEGYFSVQSAHGNIFSFGTRNFSEGVIGFTTMEGTTLNLRAATIQTQGTFLNNGIFATSTLAVTDRDLNQLMLDEKTLAYFSSNNPNGSQIEINNQSSSSNAFSAITLSQEDISNRIVTYSINNTQTYLPGAFALETNSPNGIIFSLSSNSNNELGDVHFLFDSKESLTITANSISIANALVLRGITDDEMFQMQNPEEGTLINNKTRKTLVYSDGWDWFEVPLKRIKGKAKGPTKSKFSLSL